MEKVSHQDYLAAKRQGMKTKHTKHSYWVFGKWFEIFRAW